MLTHKRRRLMISYACSLSALFVILIRIHRKRIRREQFPRLTRHIKIHRFYEDTLFNMSEKNFVRYIRMRQESLIKLGQYLLGIPTIQDMLSTSRLEFRKILCMTCAYLGSKMTTLTLSDLFGVTEETFLRYTQLVMTALVERISDLIYWPDRSQYRRIANKFNAIGKHFFPYVIGTLDGCHLEIVLTEEKVDEISYQNYHQYNSIILMAIATYDLSFIDVQVGWPGRANDYRVWRNCETWYKLDNYLADGTRPLIHSYHIVADSAFQCRKHLMVPYMNQFGQDLDEMRSNFNRSLSSKRQNIERAFALLKKRFPRLEKLNQKSTKKKL